jgi:RNA polymerase sigma-70 factor (ECF subfamily)
MWGGGQARERIDTGLVVRAQRGDGAAFEELARCSVDRLHGVARSILSDARLAEDATQQALLDIWQDLPRLREPTRFEAWSYRLLVHACYDEARRERRWMPNLPSLWIGQSIAPDEMAAVIDREQLEGGFRRLSVEQRAVVVLHHLRGLPLDEVADVLDIRVGTAHSRLHRAMQSLRASLDADRRPAVREAVRQEVPR